jgi:hypothetical protein
VLIGIRQQILALKAMTIRVGNLVHKKTKATQGLDVGKESSQDSGAPYGPQDTAYCMMMRQKGRQGDGSLRGHGHEGLVLIARWRPTSVGARARRQSAGAAGEPRW